MESSDESVSRTLISRSRHSLSSFCVCGERCASNLPPPWLSCLCLRKRSATATMAGAHCKRDRRGAEGGRVSRGAGGAAWVIHRTMIWARMTSRVDSSRRVDSRQSTVESTRVESSRLESSRVDESRRLDSSRVESSWPARITNSRPAVPAVVGRVLKELLLLIHVVGRRRIRREAPPASNWEISGGARKVQGRSPRLPLMRRQRSG